MKNLYPILLLLLISSCTITREKCQQLYPPVVVTTTDTFLQVKETIIHDTTIVAPDVSEAFVEFEVGPDSVPQVKSSKTTNGKRSSIQFTTERNNKVLQAMFRCKCDSLAIYHVFKDMDTTLKVNSKEVAIQTVNVPARLTWWQQFKVDYGGYAMGLILSVFFFYVARFVWKIFSVATPQGAAINAGGGLFSALLKLFGR